MSIPQCTLQGGSVTFHSTHPFSNLYPCKVTIGPMHFPSAEHAYQYLQRVEGNYEDWCIGGKFADSEYVLANEWKRHKGPIGTLAKIVVSHPKTFGIKLKPRDELDTSQERWFPILHAKFQGELKSKLLKTSGTLVEHDKKARVRRGKWGGLVQNGVLYGPNIMGKLLTEFRDMIRPKRPIEIEEVGHKSSDEVIRAKFKKARVEGKVVDLVSEVPEVPPVNMPQGWDTMTYYQRMIYAYSHDLAIEQINNIDAPLWGKVENAVVTFAGSIESDHTGATHGTKRRGFTEQDLINIANLFHGKATIYKVPGGPNANVLVLRGININAQACFQEITAIPEAYVDKHMWMYGKCKEKKSRVNSNYADIQQEGHMDHPDPKQRVPSLLPFGEHLAKVRDLLTRIGRLVEVDTKDLYGEVNHYLKSKTIQGIGEHMDKERNMVVGLCLGTKVRNLAFQAYQGVMPIGPKLVIDIQPGDMYFMDVNAKGTGSMMKPHVKHHATGGTGSAKYLRGVTMNRRRKLMKKEGLNKFAKAIVDGKEIFTDGNPTYL